MSGVCMGVADKSLRVCQVYREVCHVPVCVCVR